MEGLGEIYRGRAERDLPLTSLTTFRVGGKADWFFEPDRDEEVGPLLAFLSARGLPLTILGEGSNVLIRDGGVRGAVVRIGPALGGLRWEEEYARCGAGLSSRALAKRSVEAGRAGFAWAAALPGNLGGALGGNAGAFGGDMAGCFHEFSGWRFDGSRARMTRGEVEFEYRRSSLPSDLVVTEIVLKLPIAPERERAALRARYEKVLSRRAATQPKGLFTAGSCFKNPPGDHAGRLLEACGLKGREFGGARVSERHANFIEAVGESVRAADVEALMELMAAEVERQTGVRLEREVKIYGEA